MKKRVISAIIMVLLFIPILIIGKVPYCVLGCVLGILALKELLDLEKKIPKYIKFLCYLVCVFLITYNYSTFDYATVVDYKIIVTLFLLYTLTVVINGNLEKYNYKDAMWLFCMTLMIGIMFSSFIHLRNISLDIVVYVFLVSTMTDSFALFSGKLFGKHKLCPMVSPNKTIEGAIGGSVFGTIIPVLYYYFIVGNANLLVLVLVTLLLTWVGQVGDLFFSSIKRFHKVKDFSNLIPGHGGILDRLDSVLFITLGYLALLAII